MPQHLFRVVVRGEFSDLSPDVRDELAASAEQHDIFLSSYTPAGTFTYEPRLHAFSFRYEMRESSDDQSEAESEANVLARAEVLATDYLGQRNIGFKRLRANAVNMADMWRDTAP